MKRLLRHLGVALLGLLALAALALAIYLWRASPQASGSQQVVGVTAAITIERDSMGVPTVRAQNAEDLAFGLGYVHAQDRAWQLESQRRIANGELAEAFGRSVLDTDRFLRALGVKRAAAARWAWMQQQTDATTAQSRAVVEAYSRGINAALKNQARPPEMVILGLATRDWTPVDTLAWHTMMAWDLSGNWTQELLRLRVALQLPPARANLDGLNALFPPYPGEQPLLQTDLVQLYRGLGLGRDGTAEQLARLASAAPLSCVEGAGSNNWLVDGGRSDNGHVLVANDPHLKLQSPSLWYLARLEAPGVRVAGGTLPGLPFVVLGQNQQVAWAFTNTGPDTQDLYLEELRDTPQGTQVRTPDGWAAPQVIEEEIRIKGGTTEKLRVRVGRHGPFISDAGAGADLLGTGKRYALALRWVALDTAHDPIAGGLALNRARSIDDFMTANRLFLSPMQSILAGDRAGNTAFVAAARVPVRRADNDLHGLAPAPGWDSRYDWTGFIPFEQLPQERNPGRGWMATANQRVVPPDYPHFLTSDWASPYRQQRIQQLLAAQIKHNLDTFAAMQGDQVSLAARPLLPLLNAARSDHALAPAARAALQGFSGDMRADAAAPLIFWAWVRQLTIGVLQDDLGDALFERSFGSRSFRDTLEGIVTRNDATWCNDQRTPAAESCADQSNAAFTRALTELQARFGPDVSQWRWGDAHQAKGEHRPFSRVAALRPFFEVKTPVGGDTYTLNVARVLLKPDWAGDLYTDDHGPGLRTLMDAGNPQASRFVTSTGQSGLPWSRHYRDQLPLWSQVRYLPMWPEAPPSSSLTLRP
jgi:penicillin G amidase